MSVSSKEYDGIHKYLRITDIDEKSRKFNKDKLTSPDIKFNSSSKKYLLSNNDIVFARTGASTGKTYMYQKEDGIVYYAGFLIKASLSSNFDNNFIFQQTYRKRYYQRVKVISQRSGQPGINSKEYGNFDFLITQIEEQNKIGKLFKIFDNLLALYERKFKLLSRVKKYFLDNLFAEKEYPNLRFKGFTNTWEKIKLKDTQTTLTDGNYANLYPKPTDMTDADKGIPFLTGGNLKDGILDLKNAKYITKEKHSQLRSGHLEEDDIVIAVRGSLGELGYVTKQNIDWNINSQLAIIRTSKNELIGNFLLYFFLSSKGKSKLLSRQTGTALKQLPLQQLKTIVIPKTLLLEQQKISNILKTIDKTISFYKDKQQHLAEIKNTLLNTMFI